LSLPRNIAKALQIIKERSMAKINGNSKENQRQINVSQANDKTKEKQRQVTYLSLFFLCFVPRLDKIQSKRI
jgi:hypothetical protein